VGQKRDQQLACEGDYFQMNQVIGSVIPLWVKVERWVDDFARATPEATTGKAPPGSWVRIKEALDRIEAGGADGTLCRALVRQLETQLRAARAIRNGICHGLSSIEAASSARPGGFRGGPARGK
jgi:hypothetical protein